MSDDRADRSSSTLNADDVIASTYHVPSLSSAATVKNSKILSWQRQSSSCGLDQSPSAAVAASNLSINSGLSQSNIVVVGTSLLHTPKVPCLNRRRSPDDAGAVVLTDVSQSSVVTVDNEVISRNCADTSDTAVSQRNVGDAVRRRHCERVTSQQQLFPHSPSTVVSPLNSVTEHPACQQTAVNRLDSHVWSNPVVSPAGHFEINNPTTGTERQSSRRKITELLMVRGRSQPTLIRHQSMTPPPKLAQIVEELPAGVTPATSITCRQLGSNETRSKTKLSLPTSTIDKGNECDNVDDSERESHFSIKVERFLQKVSRVENLLNVDSETGVAQLARFISHGSHPAVRHRNPHFRQQREPRREKASSNYYTVSNCNRRVLPGGSEQNRSAPTSTHEEPILPQCQPPSPRLSENDCTRPMNTESLCQKIDIGNEEVNANGNDAGSRTASLDRNFRRWNIVDLMEALNDDIRLANRVSRVQQAPRLRLQLEQQQMSKDLPRPYFSMLTSRSNNRPSTFHLPVNLEKPAGNSAAAADTRSNTIAYCDASAVSITTAATVPKRAVLDYRGPENVGSHLRRRQQAVFPSLSADKTSSLTLPLPLRSSMKNIQHQQSTPPRNELSGDIFDRRSCVSLPSTISVDPPHDAERHRIDRRPGRVTWFQPLVNTAKCRDMYEPQSEVGNSSLHQGLALNAGRSAYLTSTIATQLRPCSNMWAIGRKLTCDGNAGKGGKSVTTELDLS